MLRPTFKRLNQEDNIVISSEPDKALIKVDAMDSTDDEFTLSLLEKRNSVKKETSEGEEKWSKERNVFELQLTQLQEQLVASMVQNQHLEEENKKLRKSKDVDVNKELEEEKERRKVVEARLQRLLARKKRRNSDTSHKSSEHDFDDLSTELGESLESEKAPTSVPPVGKRKQVKRKFLECKILLWNFFHERISDFINDEDAIKQDEEEEQLSVRRLKQNVARFSDAIQPLKTGYQTLYDLFSWKNPWLTVMVFLVYVYSIWLEMFLPLCLMLVILQLSINYLHARGIAQKFTHTKDSEDEGKDDQNQSSLSERYQLVLQIARKVQNTLGRLADGLEKCQNLLLCQHKEATRKIFQMTFSMFIVSILLPTNVFLMVVGLVVGVKLFVITPIYSRFPKVQRRYDDFQRIWIDLPNHAENLQRKFEECETNESRENSPQPEPKPSSSSSSKSSATSSAVVATDDADGGKKEDNASWNVIIFCDRFQLPRNEYPLHDWVEGRRCTLMDKDSPLSSMKHGRLYLTPNFLCFERNQFHSKKNIAIQLEEIIDLKKAKPISFMPGPGMAIEVYIKERVKPHMFAAMMGRDEAYDSIIRAGRLLNLSWSKK
ncbi:GRAM domain-containing protein 4-like isoform X1 [Hydractinia symbiolongicarpus]|uniref:GRAM domain-containing protein 4-like isoform X1 n=2 Tax=Hydractinia symbiolongicarpus TaxID=13093 RepID=UPI00254C066A|nr:GRAM domain-containing protein 4-like isoform X1 [Hydractinia symbiolongicarpus]